MSSRPINVNYGVPQGSPFSPLLFLLYVADVPFKEMGNCNSTQFADDLSISITNKRVGRNIKQLQAALDKLSHWRDRWRIKLSPAKSRLIHFTGRKRNKPTETVRINDIDIETYLRQPTTHSGRTTKQTKTGLQQNIRPF